MYICTVGVVWPDPTTALNHSTALECPSESTRALLCGDVLLVVAPPAELVAPRSAVF
jgi:hypothetical protein